MRRLTMTWLFLAIMPLAGGCADDEVGPGKALVKWQVKGSTCDKAGLSDVRVDLLQSGDPVLSEGGKCTDGQVLIEDVPVGTYDVRVLGFDAQNNPTHEGNHQGLSVHEGDTPSSPPTPVPLVARKGTLLLAWRFPNNKSNLCSFNNVAEVEVNVSQAGTVVQHFAGVFPCEPAFADPKKLPAPLENGWIVLSDIPPGEAELVLFGLSPEGDRIYAGADTVNVANVGYVQITVTLEPCDGGCV